MEPENNKRPNAALINREWFESAKGVLNETQLASLCLHAITYVLYGEDKIRRDNAVGIVFQMVRPALDSDIAKYHERCVRNAINARGRLERVAASGSERQQAAANTTTTTTTTTTTAPISLQGDDPKKERERDMWLCYGYFWAIGSKAIEQELCAFWSYYEALGWKNNKGAAIVSRLACARMWRRQFEGGVPPAGASVWFGVVKECDVLDYKVFTIYAGAAIGANGLIIRLRCTPDYYAKLINHVPNIERTMCKAFRVEECNIEYIQ